MILQELKEANSAMLDSVNAVRDKQAVENLKVQLDSLSNITTQLEQLLSLMDALKNKGFVETIITEESKQTLQDAVDQCGRKVNDHNLEAGTVTALKTAVDLCRNLTESKWKAVAEERSRATIEALTSLRVLLTDKRAVDDILEYLNKVVVTMPISEKGLDTFSTRLNNGKKIIDDLHFTSDKEIRAFVDKVRGRKATIGDVTSKVLDWLKENHLTDKIRLSF
jgi:hypothetical protein